MCYEGHYFAFILKEFYKYPHPVSSKPKNIRMVSVFILCLLLHPRLCFLYFTFLLQYFWFYFVLLTSPLVSDPYSLPLCNSRLCESLPRPDVLHLCPIIPASCVGLVCVLPVLCASLSSPLVSCFTPLVPCVLWFLDPFLCSLN